MSTLDDDAVGGEDAGQARGKSRKKNRESIFLGAQVLFEGAKAPVTARVRNISAGGMMIDLVGAVHKGQTLKAELKNIGEVNGHVAWVTESRVGIAFDDVIDPMQARQQIGSQNSGVTFTRHYTAGSRPGLGVR